METAIDLNWIPLGAGGHSVRFNGIVYESLTASVQRRPRHDIYHSALELRMPDRVYTVEMTPVPNSRGWERGVVAEGPVGIKWAGRLRIFRYEVRRWKDGVIPDLGHAVSPPVHLTDDARVVERVFGLLPAVPALTWGRDESRRGRCGAATRSSPGRSPTPGSRLRRSACPQEVELRAGMPASRSPKR